ncbi:MAG: M1 family aminopeptidase [bacterium]
MRFSLLLLSALLFSSTACLAKDAGRTVQTDTAHFYMKHSFDVLRYSLDIDLFPCYSTPYPKSFKANIQITFRADSLLSMIMINAVNSSLTIDSVNGNASSFVHTNDTLRIALDRNYLPGDTAEVRIYYRHLNVVDNAFYTSAGYVFTDCPPEGARKWIPCWDRPSDKALWDLHAKVPTSVRLASNGLLNDSTSNGDTLTYHWKTQFPLSTYLITISSKVGFLIHKGFWHTLSEPNDSIPYLLYYKPNENIGITDSILAPITDFYSEIFGDYALEKIGFSTLNGSFPWGGMENQTMVNLMPGGYANGDLIAHEHSHQWFGDMITCGTWADIWLNEGFGTYCAHLWTENQSGYNVYKNKMNLLANYYLSNNPGYPLYNPSWALHTPPGYKLYNVAISYNKGACVLHQLRYVLGDSLFFEVMNSYATDTAYRFKNAITEDFVVKTSSIAGSDMQWFFDEWVYSPDHPVYENTAEITDSGGAWRIHLTIYQTQVNTIFFRMPVQFFVNFDDGTDTLFQIINDINPQSFDLTFAKRPLNLSFDPFRNILLKKSNVLVSIKESPGAEGEDLLQADPNPFSQELRINYQVARPGNARISLIDSSGRTVKVLADGPHDKGRFRIIFSGDSLPSGGYIIVFETVNNREQKRVIRL